MSEYQAFARDRQSEIERMSHDADLRRLSRAWMDRAQGARYPYHFEWLGRPIIQYPQDIVAMQEIIWTVKPDLIIETGIAHGGSLIFSASMLALNGLCGGPQGAEVIGVDIDIRAHNRSAIEAHPLASRISMIEGSSTDADVVARIRAKAEGKRSVLVQLDSNHAHDHVLAELHAYAPMVSVGSYCVVFDTVVEDLPEEIFVDRPWGRGNNAKTAVAEFLRSGDGLKFESDATVHTKLMVTVAPDGYLKRMAT
ncbi:MAG: cephalosporin hydroxylase family protein [Xanthobacteraceae bacterium]|nr:cephalosporin hydroxylase family protein [Xanthobacteraceae bacterium]